MIANSISFVQKEEQTTARKRLCLGRALLGLLVLIFFAACGSGGSGSEAEASPKLANNTQPRGQLFPEAVTIITRYTDGQGSYCSGAFIGQHAVLFAAHCVASLLSGDNLQSIEVYGVDGAGSPRIYNGTLVHIPGNWNVAEAIPGLSLIASPYDVAVLEVAEAYDGITAIISTATPFLGEQLTLVASGTDQAGNVHPDPLIGHARVEGVTENPGFILWRNDADDTFVCPGDSGGAVYRTFNGRVFLSGIIQGATLAENGQCGAGQLSVSLRITPEIVEYIRAVIGENFAYAG